MAESLGVRRWRSASTETFGSHFGIDFENFSTLSENAKTIDFDDSYTDLHENTIPKPFILASIFHDFFMFFRNPSRTPSKIDFGGPRVPVYPPKCDFGSIFWFQGILKSAPGPLATRQSVSGWFCPPRVPYLALHPTSHITFSTHLPHLGYVHLHILLFYCS